MSFFRRLVGTFSSTGYVLSGEWIPVVSSWIAAARWDDSKATLWIRTKTGRAYPWCEGISRDVARNFFRQDSKGKWIWRNFPPRGLHRRGRGRRLRRG